MIFRQAFNKDIPAMHKVRISVVENKLSDPNRITPEMYISYLNEIGRGWICEVDEEIIGFSVACLKDSSIWALFVKPTYEGQGIGKKLLKMAVDWLFENEVTEIFLSTGTKTRADEFYQQQGWKKGKLLDNGEIEYKLEKL
jgi:GNAT superfamily N-acetyltransferase